MPKSVRAAARWSAASLSVCAAVVLAALMLALGLGAVHADPLPGPPAGLSGWDVAWYGLMALQQANPAAQAAALLGIIAAAGLVARAYVRRATAPEWQVAVMAAFANQARDIHSLSSQVDAAIEGVNQLRIDIVRHTLECPAGRPGPAGQPGASP